MAVTNDRGETDLATLLSTMQPELRDGSYVFCSVGRAPTSAESAAAVTTVREREGTTLVLTEDDAIALGHGGHPPMSWITLTVHSSLDAVGLTAAVSTALASDGIPCNVVAGFFHDHLFVPAAMAGDALDSLARLAG